jgi:hypothetical protein
VPEAIGGGTEDEDVNVELRPHSAGRRSEREYAAAAVLRAQCRGVGRRA